MLRCALLAGAIALTALKAVACDTALLLTIDVSNSVDPAEYRIQTDGLADALQDPEIVDIMVSGQGRLTRGACT